MELLAKAERVTGDEAHPARGRDEAGLFLPVGERDQEARAQHHVLKRVAERPLFAVEYNVVCF